MKLLYAIEVSGVCNSNCSYCPYSTKKRKGFMKLSTFKRCLEVVKELNQDYICLHNLGEPLLHPNLVEFIKRIK